MADYPAPKIRNLTLVGHASAGKTVLAEAMLACAGEIGRMGSIEAGTTQSDFHPSEKDHGISVHATLLTLEWAGAKLNLLDAPGYQDFSGEALSALRVGDSAVIVVNASQGVAAGTDKMWKAADEFHLPKTLVVTGIDKPNTDFNAVLEQAREHFGTNVFPLTLPLEGGPGFNRLLDVMRSEVLTYRTDQSGAFTEAPAEGALADQVKALHRQLIEYVAESDNALMEKFFEQDGLSEEELRQGLHQALEDGVFVPVFAVSGLNNIGVSRLLDHIAKYESSPVDHHRVKGRTPEGVMIEVDLADKGTVMHVFKTMNEPGVGEFSLFRVYAGEVRNGQELFNPARNTTERIGQLYYLNGHKRAPTTVLGAGDIGAAVKLRDTHTGNTLCDPERPVVLPAVKFPRPNIHGALVCESRGDEDKFAVGLNTLREEDPSFHHRVDDEVHQTIISGQGEIHLQVTLERLVRRFGVKVSMVPPRVPYRETISGTGEAKYRHKKQSGGAGQFAEVWLRIAPGEPGSGIDFKQSLVGTNVDRVFVPSVEKGVHQACQEGVIAGCNIVDVQIDFYDGKMHPVDSKDIAFQIAGYHAFKDAFAQARPGLMEPIYEIVVTVPEDCVGDVLGDLSSRRGRIMGVDADGHFQAIKAHVPQRELHNYSTRLRSLTASRGVHTETYVSHERVPRELEATIIAEAQAARATE
ncbi:elongation factor G [Actomonas aquatica]|uniref:Elongation factor G n=1 Tax=Actomonas aquatica TaxID=2866162 RepID=A0ABZ1CBB3_9BACT|nr:elongation factor G [Opitutus sp. WL0086]WRQ87864.1 elongation factor G [Opitutus sp. WL0086]